MLTHSLVYVVDDDSAVRSSIQAILETAGFGVRTFESAVQFLEECTPDKFGCIICDLRMPELGGMELQRRVAALYPDVPIIFVTAHGDIKSAVQAMKAGAVDFIEKPFEAPALVATIKTALQPSRRSSPQMAHARSHKLITILTQRELDVYRSLLFGSTTKDIARELQISPRTVEIHRGNLMRKLGARNLLHLIRIAIECGMFPDTPHG